MLLHRVQAKQPTDDRAIDVLQPIFRSRASPQRGEAEFARRASLDSYAEQCGRFGMTLLPTRIWLPADADKRDEVASPSCPALLIGPRLPYRQLGRGCVVSAKTGSRWQSWVRPDGARTRLRPCSYSEFTQGQREQQYPRQNGRSSPTPTHNACTVDQIPVPQSRLV
jgi:hypothetical protein